MRKILKPINIETNSVDPRGRPIILAMHPKFMALRPKGTRESYNIDYQAVFALAARQSAATTGK